MEKLSCPACAGHKTNRFGHQNGRQCFICRACQKTGRENPGTTAIAPECRAEILAAYQERGSLRGLSRIFGVSRDTISAWLKKVSSLSPLKQTLLKAKKSDVRELDELWSFVQQRRNKQWVWLAQCRRTRQIVAYAIGDRSETTCRVLWERVPKCYKKCAVSTDFWKAYAEVLPEAQHLVTGKGARETPHRAIQ